MYTHSQMRISNTGNLNITGEHQGQYPGCAKCSFHKMSPLGESEQTV